MVDMLLEYSLFLAEVITFVLAIGIVLGMLYSFSRKAKSAGKLEVRSLNENYRDMSLYIKSEVLSKKEFKSEIKEAKAQIKHEKKTSKSESSERRKRIYVIDFHGDIKATAAASLRKEITAILALASTKDEVLVRLENAGGLVHEHGFAASQLERIRGRGIPLTIAVDKIAASGGYMMACVANKIIAAPFAVLGSIGVLAQIPNFHRLLKKSGIDFEQIKAGELKRTLTMFGANTDEDREKFSEQLEDTHRMFKDYVLANRSHLDIDTVATGEHWYGKRALEMNLVDEILTSDDYLLSASEHADLYEIRYAAHKTLSDRLVSVVQSLVSGFVP